MIDLSAVYAQSQQLARLMLIPLAVLAVLSIALIAAWLLSWIPDRPMRIMRTIVAAGWALLAFVYLPALHFIGPIPDVRDAERIVQDATGVTALHCNADSLNQLEDEGGSVCAFSYDGAQYQGLLTVDADHQATLHKATAYDTVPVRDSAE